MRGGASGAKTIVALSPCATSGSTGPPVEGSPPPVVVIDDKMLTFRGDPNEAWLRAEEFLVEEMRALEIAK